MMGTALHKSIESALQFSRGAQQKDCLLSCFSLYSISTTSLLSCRLVTKTTTSVDNIISFGEEKSSIQNSQYCRTHVTGITLHMVRFSFWNVFVSYTIAEYLCLSVCLHASCHYLTICDDRCTL